ncbi:MAG: hypothetical protein CMO01_00160 [Thalassobius sp.]|nr:hypothetical protein [Thalassovita sp.]
MRADLVLDDAGHLGSHAAVLHRGHLAASPVFVADFEPLYPGCAEISVQRAANERPQDVLVDGGVPVPVGVDLFSKSRARRQYDIDGDAGLLGPCHELRVRQDLLHLAGHVIADLGRVRVADVEVVFRQGAPRVPDVLHSQRLDLVVEGSILADPVARGERVRPEMGLGEGMCGQALWDEQEGHVHLRVFRNIGRGSGAPTVYAKGPLSSGTGNPLSTAN